MPKKTKKQKILAQQRRRTTLIQHSDTSSVHLPENNTPSATFSFHGSHAPVRSVENTENREELIIIRKDLNKTIILALIAITIELGVYSMLRGT